MKKILTLALVLICLNGCVPAVLVAVGATAGGAIVYDKRSFSTMKSDQHATHVAQYWINSDTELKGHSHINVSVFNQIALLVGQAQTQQLRERAYKIMKKVDGVKANLQCYYHCRF